MNLGTIYNRVVSWNSRRYAREHNFNLSVDLLQEELLEYFEAKSNADQLDAMCDTVYVAMGVMWKLNLSDEEMNEVAAVAHKEVVDLINENSVEPIHLALHLLQLMKTDMQYPTAVAAQSILTLAIGQMTAMGLKMEDSIKAMLIVCDANDSKSVKKTASNVKANSGDKGEFFKDPAPRLKRLLEEVRAKRGH